AFFVVDGAPVRPCALPWPVIVKPSEHDASVGIDQGSVVTTQAQLERRVAYLREHYGGPVLVEEFVPGREFNLSLIELPDLQVLPLYEVIFDGAGPGRWPIMTYDAKWHGDSPEYAAAREAYPDDLPPRLAARLR